MAESVFDSVEKLTPNKNDPEYPNGGSRKNSGSARR